MAGAPPPGPRPPFPDRKRGPGDFGGGGSPGEGGWRKRPRFDDSFSSPGAPPATLRVLVRNQDAGGIIGKGGENIKRLRKQYDCQVMLPDSAGAPERVMTMMGGIDACLGVLRDMLTTLGLDSGLGDNGQREIQILIPQPFMGTIIGTGGTKIKDLRERTSAKIKIFMEPMPNSNERSIQIIGSHDQIIECIQHFLNEISKKEPREPIYLYEPGAPMFTGDFPPRGRGGGGGFSNRGRGRGGQGGFGGGDGGGGGGGWRGGRGGGRGRGGRGGGRGSYNGSSRGGRGGGGAGGYMGQNQSNQFNPPPVQQGGGGFGGGAPPPAVGYSQAPPPAMGNDQQQQGMGAPPPMPQNVGMNPATGGQPQAYPQPPQLLNQQPVTPRQTQQVTIPSEYADAIMGPGGSNLEQIKNMSSCEITIDVPKPGSSERIITIVGSSTSIQWAQQLLQKSVREKYPNV